MNGIVKFSELSFSFTPADVQLRLNQNGGIYDNGRARSILYRERILDLFHDGLGQREIARQTNAAPSYVNKVVHRYINENTVFRPERCVYPKPKINQEALEYIEVQKLVQPSIYGSEIRQRVLLDGVVHPADLPSVSQINRVTHEQLLMTKKKITCIPKESITPQVVAAVDNYLAEIVQIADGTKLHFFDETSVIKTTGNRKYGSAPIGMPAFEIQRYASNANYTLNLLHTFNKIDFFNIVDGPSNGMELLSFFDEALQVELTDGSAALERGDYVIMDNCGFHHGRRIEPVLRNMLANCGITLIYQPPYSPHLNPCELCFNQVKKFLCKHNMLATNETKIAIAEAVLDISPRNCYSYFKHIGYI